MAKSMLANREAYASWALAILVGLVLSTGCTGPEKQKAALFCAEGYTRIGAMADEQVAIFSNGEEIVIIVSGAKTVMRDPYRAVKLAGMLDVPDALGMLHTVLAEDADGGSLQAHYEMSAEPGRLSMSVRLGDKEAEAVFSLRGGEGAAKASARVTASEAVDVAAALRRYLMTRWGIKPPTLDD